MWHTLRYIGDMGKKTNTNKKTNVSCWTELVFHIAIADPFFGIVAFSTSYSLICLQWDVLNN